MTLTAYCEERFRITVSLGPGSASGEKGKKRGQMGKIFPLFPHNTKPGHRLDERQTKKTVNTRNICGMLLCCEKKDNQA